MVPNQGRPGRLIPHGCAKSWAWGASASNNNFKLQFRPRQRPHVTPDVTNSFKPFSTEPTYFGNLLPSPPTNDPTSLKLCPRVERLQTSRAGGEQGGGGGCSVNPTGLRGCGSLGTGTGPPDCRLSPTPQEEPWGRSNWPGNSHLPAFWPHGQCRPKPLLWGQVHGAREALCFLGVQQRPRSCLPGPGLCYLTALMRWEKLLEAKN